MVHTTSRTLLGPLFILAAATSAAGCASSGGAAGTASAGSHKRARGYEIREANTELAEAGAGDVTLEHGVISAEEAQRAVMQRWTALSRCYGEAGEAMTFAGGSVTMRFVVSRTGTTTDVRVAESRLGNFAAERCLIAVGRTVTFPRPQGSATATVDYSLEFRATGELPVMELGAERITSELPGLLSHLAGACAGLGADELMATLYIGARGVVRSVGLATDTAVEPEAAACVAAAIHQWTAPAAAPGGRTIGRTTLALRNADVIAARESPQASRRTRLTSARSRRR